MGRAAVQEEGREGKTAKAVWGQGSRCRRRLQSEARSVGSCAPGKLLGTAGGDDGQASLGQSSQRGGGRRQENWQGRKGEACVGS